MKNCLSDSKFMNLLFVNICIQDMETTALFDTGAGMTVITRKFLERLKITAENHILHAGNNNGLIRTRQTAVISNVRFGEIYIEKLRVIVTDDSDFAFCDEGGASFPAEMLLGWDVISRYCWSYSWKSSILSVTTSKKASALSNPDAKQGPIVFPEYLGYRFKARVDTGHTCSALNSAWHRRLSTVEWHETENVGIGSIQHTSSPYIKDFPIRFQDYLIHLRDVDISEKIYGQPDDIEALLGYDFLEGIDWRLDKEFQLG